MKVSSIAQLPIAVRALLNVRLAESAFSDYEGHSEWLKSEGYNIGKSSLHRYGQLRQEELTKIIDATKSNQLAVWEFRMRCLELAIQLDPSNPQKRADELFSWIQAV